jgi:hypothetical protein
MKITVMIAMVAMLGSMAWAAAKSADQKVLACIEVNGENADVVAVARMTATRVFESAGVNLEWHTDRRFCEAHRDQVIKVSLSLNTPKDLAVGALAYALPYEGVHIQVFYDRMANAGNDLRPKLLAYVIVHEITHVLQGVDRHCDSGIMMAHWSAHEFGRMRFGQLRFAKEDIELIHDGLAARAAHLAPGTQASATKFVATRPLAER